VGGCGSIYKNTDPFHQPCTLHLPPIVQSALVTTPRDGRFQQRPVSAFDLCAGFPGAAGEIDFLAAAVALVRFFELVGKDFFFGTAFGALAGKRFQGFELLVTGAMLGCGHGRPPFSGGVA
jgi:hypothetical protein